MKEILIKQSQFDALIECIEKLTKAVESLTIPAAPVVKEVPTIDESLPKAAEYQTLGQRGYIDIIRVREQLKRKRGVDDESIALKNLGIKTIKMRDAGGVRNCITKEEADRICEYYGFTRRTRKNKTNQ